MTIVSCFSCLPNDLPFSSERPGRVRAYHGREEPRAQPAASRHEPTFERTRVAFGCCNGLLDSSPPWTLPLTVLPLFLRSDPSFDPDDAVDRVRERFDRSSAAFAPIAVNDGFQAWRIRHRQSERWGVAHGAIAAVLRNGRES